MKSQYILDLLRRNSRVIIPNFGAFLLKSKPQSENDTELNISFNDFLKFNDGVLIDYVSQAEQIDKYEAEHQVKEYVSKIQYNLINEGSFMLEGLGSIVKDDKGNLKFSKAGNNELSTEASQEPVKEKSQTKTGLSPFTPGQQPPKPEPKPQKEEKSGFDIPKRETPKPTPVQTQNNPPVSKATSTTPKSTRKKKKLLPIWRHILIIASVLIIVAVILYLAGFFDSPGQEQTVNKNQIAQTSQTTDQDASLHTHETENQENNTQEESEPKKEEPTTTKPDIVETSDNTSAKENNVPAKKEMATSTQTEQKTTTTKPKVENTPKKTTPTRTQTTTDNQNLNYHIIAASFKDKGNAYNYVLKLRNQGFSSRIVNKHNDFYRVSFNSYKTRREALNALPDIRSVHNPNAWYLYYKIDN